MIEPRILLDRESNLFQALDRAATERRCVFVSGLSGVGKSLMLQQLALIARDRGRTAYSLQWDAARAPFDRPDILAVYPEIEGATHVAIRRAVGLWARSAIAEWDRHHLGGAPLLIGEAPLIGGRMIELARQEADGVEPLLASERTEFLIPVPSADVRKRVVASRRREIDTPANERESLSARPSLMDVHWQEIGAVADRLGVPRNSTGDGYDPAVYAAVYKSVLRHRRCIDLPITAVLPVATSAHELDALSGELIPTDDEVDRAVAQVESYPPERLEDDAKNWFRV